MHVTPNQDFDEVEGDLDGIDSDFSVFCQGVQTVDVDAGLSSVLVGVLLCGPRHNGRGGGWSEGTFDRAHCNERGGEHSLGCLPL